jgi:hypothetical protein
MALDVSNIPDERRFDRILDPNGELDYTVDWKNALGNQIIQSVSTTLSTTAQAAGIEIIEEAHTDTTATVRIGVVASDENATEFQHPGTEYAFEMQMTDSDGQIWELSFAFTVSQQ